MPVTYNLIASNTLSSSAASVTFSAIPNTYTDLVLRISARGSEAGTLNPFNIRLNGSSSTIYSYTQVFSDGTAQSNRSSNGTLIDGVHNGTATTSNTFNNMEIYIPSYTASQNKPLSISFVVENNSATVYNVTALAGLFRSTSAITEINLSQQSTFNFLSGSSFFLYGIKNS